MLEIVVYWYSFSNPRTMCIHYGFSLLIARGPNVFRFFFSVLCVSFCWLVRNLVGSPSPFITEQQSTISMVFCVGFCMHMCPSSKGVLGCVHCVRARARTHSVDFLCACACPRASHVASVP